MFKSKVYIKRRQELKEKVKRGVILFIGNDESQVLIRDTVHKFRQNSNFLYYWGMNEPVLAALIDIDNDKEILVGHDLVTEEIIWEGEQQKLTEKAKSIGVGETTEISTLKGILLNYRKGRKRIHYLPQHLDNNIGKISDLLNISIKQVAQRHSVELTKAVISQRLIKSKKEISEIEKALKISYKLHTSAMRKTKPGKYEYEIVKGMEKILISKGSRWAYLPIFTIRGERLHNHHYNNNSATIISDNRCHYRLSRPASRNPKSHLCKCSSDTSRTSFYLHLYNHRLYRWFGYRRTSLAQYNNRDSNDRPYHVPTFLNH